LNRHAGLHFVIVVKCVDVKSQSLLFEQFQEPDRFYAPHAFWFWNAPDELKTPAHFAQMAQQISLQGLNPGAVQARYYREGEPFWQTDAWFDCFDMALEATSQSKTHMTYTMGDPSFSDKYILAEHPQLKAQSLGWHVQDIKGGESANLPDCLFHVAGKLDSQNIVAQSIAIIESDQAAMWRAPDGGSWRVYSFYTYHAYHHGPGKPINFLDRRITEPWLTVENSRYEQRFAEHFGQTMRYVFFDLEGSYGYKLVWSDDLAEAYRQAKGRDIRLDLPLLIEEDRQGIWAKVRWDWFDVVSRLYIDCLMLPLDRWCRQRDMLMTCHFWEESLSKQAVLTGDFMGALRACSMPGTDALFETIHDPRYFRETQSVCEFEGRPCMCEALGIAGWHMTPNDMKAAVNSAIAHGVTHLILHGINSSPDLQKVAYPPDFFACNPYWRYMHLLTDFVRRACFVNDRGYLDAKVLLLCPMDSVWALMGDAYFDPSVPQNVHGELPEDVAYAHVHQVHAMDESYTHAIHQLSDACVEHMIADSHYLSRMQVDDGYLKLGSFAFETLILPPLKLLPLQVMQRIVDFARVGGKVIALGTLPDASAEVGVGDPQVLALGEQLQQCSCYIQAHDGLQACLSDSKSGLDPRVTFESGQFPLITTCRKIDQCHLIWLANNHDQRQQFVLLIANVQGAAQKWDCENGTSRRVTTSLLPDGRYRVALELAPYEAYWLVFDPMSNDGPTPQQCEMTESSQSVCILDGPWLVSIDAEDQPCLPQHDLAVPGWLLEGQTKRSLESWLNWGLERFTGFVDYHKQIQLEYVRGDEQLDLGKVKHTVEVWINGQHAGVRLWPAFRFRIGHLLQPGNNDIHIKVGNLVLNAMTQDPNYNWKWFKAPVASQLDCGLLGPVILR
jgi:hypothetical protein